jgi:hypothetical protein
MPKPAFTLKFNGTEMNVLLAALEALAPRGSAGGARVEITPAERQREFREAVTERQRAAMWRRLWKMDCEA